MMGGQSPLLDIWRAAPKNVAWAAVRGIGRRTPVSNPAGLGTTCCSHGPRRVMESKPRKDEKTTRAYVSTGAWPSRSPMLGTWTWRTAGSSKVETHDLALPDRAMSVTSPPARR